MPRKWKLTGAPDTFVEVAFQEGANEAHVLTSSVGSIHLGSGVPMFAVS